MTEQIFIFHLRAFYPFHNTQITSLDDTIDVLSHDYHDALQQARKEFKRKHPEVDRVKVIDWEDIHVLDYEIG